MRQENINYMMVGVFVLGMLTLLLVVLVELTGRAGTTDTYYAYFQNIAGLTNSTVVTYEGYPVGRIGDIEPVQGAGPTGYKVELRVTHGWKIPEDSIARILSFSLLSEFVIDIKEGASKTALAPGAQMRGQESVDIYAAMGAIAGEVGDLSENGIKPLLDKLNHHVDVLGSRLDSSVPEILGRTETILTKLDQSADSLHDVLGSGNQARISSVLTNADKLTANLLEMSSNVEQTRAQLDELLKRSNSLMAESGKDVRESVAHLRDTLEVISQHIDSFVFNMEGTSRNLYEFTRQVRQNPGLLLGSAPPGDKGGSTTAPAAGAR